MKKCRATEAIAEACADSPRQHGCAAPRRQDRGQRRFIFEVRVLVIAHASALSFAIFSLKRIFMNVSVGSLDALAKALETLPHFQKWVELDKTWARVSQSSEV